MGMGTLWVRIKVTLEDKLWMNKRIKEGIYLEIQNGKCTMTFMDVYET